MTQCTVKRFRACLRLQAGVILRTNHPGMNEREFAMTLSRARNLASRTSIPASLALGLTFEFHGFLIIACFSVLSHDG